MLGVLNMPKFWLWQSSEYGRVLNTQGLHSILNMPEWAILEFEYILGSKYASILNMPEWALTEFEYILGSKYASILNILEYALTEFEYISGSKYTMILNMAGFWICMSYAGFWICHNMAEYVWIGHKYAWLCLNLQ